MLFARISQSGTTVLVCFVSKLNVHQHKYSTVEKEALALLIAVRTFSVYFGSTVVTAYTDYSPLQFLERMAPHNAKRLRWSLKLQQHICPTSFRDFRIF